MPLPMQAIKQKALECTHVGRQKRSRWETRHHGTNNAPKTASETQWDTQRRDSASQAEAGRQLQDKTRLGPPDGGPGGGQVGPP